MLPRDKGPSCAFIYSSVQWRQNPQNGCCETHRPHTRAHTHTHRHAHTHAHARSSTCSNSRTHTLMRVCLRAHTHARSWEHAHTRTHTRSGTFSHVGTTLGGDDKTVQNVLAHRAGARLPKISVPKRAVPCDLDVGLLLGLPLQEQPLHTRC